MKTKLLLTLIFTLCASSLWAYDTIVDGIYYNLIDKAKGAIVTRGDNKYSGEIIIPSTIKVGEISYNVTSIEEKAFLSCKALSSITIPNSVTTIGDLAFAYCYGLTSFTIPNSVTSIGRQAFHECTGLASITIPNSVTSMGGDTFWDCTGLTSITIPNSLSSIVYGAFEGFCI